jgi:hypothetical protein
MSRFTRDVCRERQLCVNRVSEHIENAADGTGSLILETPHRILGGRIFELLVFHTEGIAVEIRPGQLSCRGGLLL